MRKFSSKYCYPITFTLLVGCSQNPEKPSTQAVIPASNPSVTTQTSAISASYKIIKTEDVSIPGRKRASVSILIQDKNAAMDNIRAALTDASKKQNAVVVMAFAYWPGTDLNSVYSAGKLVWSSDGKGWTSDEQLPSDGQFEGKPYPKESPKKSVASLPEPKRREIFYKIGEAEDKAQNEAEEKYPTNPDHLTGAGKWDQARANVDRNAEEINRLTEKYTNALRKKYKITEKQLFDIKVEGATKNWPLPNPEESTN
jgi:hypothetical protein